MWRRGSRGGRVTDYLKYRKPKSCENLSLPANNLPWDFWMASFSMLPISSLEPPLTEYPLVLNAKVKIRSIRNNHPKVYVYQTHGSLGIKTEGFYLNLLSKVTFLLSIPGRWSSRRKEVSPAPGSSVYLRKQPSA